MADQKKEDPLISVEGTEGLDFSDQLDEGSEDEKERQLQGQETDEEILTPEEFAAKYPHLKIKLQVAGKEIIEAPAEIAKYKQKYAGREVSTDRMAQEMNRRLQELESRAVINERKAVVIESPKKKPEDITPEDFVDERANQFFENKLRPEIDQIKAGLQALSGVVLTPQNVQESAKARLKQGGIPDVSDFEELQPKIIEYYEEQLGRSVQAKELNAKNWAEGYLFVSKRNGKGPEKKPEKIIAKPGGGGGGGGGGYRPTVIKTGKPLHEMEPEERHSYIKSKFKPLPTKESGG